jgi:predicted permease
MPQLGRFARELRARLWKPSVEEEVRRELGNHLEMLEQELVARGMDPAAAAIPMVRGIGSAAIPRLDEMALDWRVLGFALGACLATGVVFGLAPALHLVRSGGARGTGAPGLLHGGARTVDAGRLRSALVVTSVALAMLLLVCAGLVGGSFVKLMRVDLGFSHDQVVTASLALPMRPSSEDSTPGSYSPEQAAAFHVELSRRLAAAPGVRAAGAVSIAPFSGGNTSMDYEPVGQVRTRGEYRSGDWRVVTPGYFAAVGIPLVRGRLFDESDRPPAPTTMVINETMARRGWPEGDPLGRQVRLGSDLVVTVVGIVRDTRHVNVDSLPPAAMYFAHGQFPLAAMWITVRAAGDPASLGAVIRREVAALDPSLAVAGLRPLTHLVTDSTAEPRLIVLVFAMFASAALVLATIGLYGVVSYTVSQRSREIGVRLALGEAPRRIVRAVLGQGVRLAAVGVVSGGVAAYAAAGVLRAILFETEPTDAATFLAIGGLLMVVAIAASVSPARRASRVDPITALRSE